MTSHRILSYTLSPLALLLASCGTGAVGESSQGEPIIAATGRDIMSQNYGTFAEPWAAAFIPGTAMLFVTEKAGTAKIVDTSTDTPKLITVSGLPKVDYGGQGGLGDVAFLDAESAPSLENRTIYLTWAEAGDNDTRGAAVGRGTLRCATADACEVTDLTVIWRQPKVTGRGHYSHRIAVSPDGQHLYIASGDRQKMDPAQDTSNNLGSIVRLNLDGTPASGNPLPANPELWSWGHRNTLGLAFDAAGKLWNIEHGAAGGDEINLVKPGANYGWPLVSEGDHYDGAKIPRHSTRPEFAAPAVSWNPVIAPGDMIIYRGDLFNEWKGQAVIAAMKPAGLVRVSFDGEKANEVGRHAFERRVREVVEGPDGAIWVLEDGRGTGKGDLIRLTPG